MSASQNTNESSDDSSSDDNALIIAAVVVGITAIIAGVILVVVIIWCRWNKSRRTLHISEKYVTETQAVISSNGLPADEHQANDKLAEVKRHADHKSVLDENEAKNDGTIVNVPMDSGNYERLTQIPYPYSRRGTMGKDRPKVTCMDYVTVGVASDYEEALHTYANIRGVHGCVNAAEYEEFVPSSNNSTVDVDELYLDPGQCVMKMCDCFENKKRCVINKSDISISEKLGSGEFGTVHFGLWSNGSADPVQVAVKTLNSQCSESDRVKFMREAAIMGQFEDKYIVQLFGVVLEDDNMMIVLEYMPEGDLHDYLTALKAKTPLDDLCKHKDDLLSFCRNISAGLDHLYRKRFVHRDLAARNILLSSDYVCKIADFGMARDVADDTYYKITGGKIPVKWTAPEAIFYKKYSVLSDVWSYGCVLYETWSLGHKPFENDHATAYLHKISTGYRLPPPPGCPRAIYELMIQCWHPVADQRITPCSILRTLQKSDKILLSDNDEVQSTKLGDALSTSSQLYPDLQNIYAET